MFNAEIYRQRRNLLKQQIGSGFILFLGNQESPMNYADNPYPFRQDSSFLYFWGLDSPGLAAIINVDEDKEVLLGNDLTVEQIVWTGPQETISKKAEKAGVTASRPLHELEPLVKKANQKGQTVHYLPQYRADNKLLLSSLMEIEASKINQSVSTDLVKAVISQRSIKSEEEIAQIEAALDITYEMHTMAMKMTRPGMVEREVAGAMEGLVLSRGGQVAFPIIFSVHGETLHNPFHNNVMQAGDIVVNDSGAVSAIHYASDITRTIPVSGKFAEKQAHIYEIVLDALELAIQAIKPGKKFKEIHLLASKCLATGLKDLGLMKGNVVEAVEAGAHALFFQCGLGHMMGLDVHDMEALGEDLVGYDEETRRSSQFGLSHLRLGKRLKPYYVLTVEPGIYFIPQLIDQWKAQKRFPEFINYEMVEKFRDFGGIRIEEDIVVTEDGCRILGKPIPRTIQEIEDLASD
ncbi:MAG: aminopeptidase P family protein [bacterium]